MITGQATGISTSGFGQTSFGRVDFNGLIFDDATDATEKVKTVSFKPRTSFNENNVDPASFDSALIQELDRVEIVILDLRNVQYIDDPFFGKIISLNKKLIGSGRKLGLIIPDGDVRESMLVKQLDKVFTNSREVADLMTRLESVQVGELTPLNYVVPVLTAPSPARSIHEVRAELGQAPPKPLSEVVSVSQAEGVATVTFSSTKLDSEIPGIQTFGAYLRGLTAGCQAVVLNFTNVSFIGNEVIGGLFTLKQNTPKLTAIEVSGQPLDKMKTTRVSAFLGVV